MTTDDLRTRAREAAYEQCANDEQGDAFIDGALWHAAQQPSREQIARAMMMVRGSYLLTEGGEPSPMPGDYRYADAVLDLLNGDESDE